MEYTEQQFMQVAEPTMGMLEAAAAAGESFDQFYNRMSSAMQSDRGRIEVVIKESPFERSEIRLSFNEEIKDQILHVSFCPFEWQAMFLAVATANDMFIFKAPITDDFLENNDNTLLRCEHVCTFNTNDKIVSLAWSPETSINPPMKVMILTAFHREGLALCSWDGETSTALVQKLPGHRGFVNSVHVEPLIGDSWASVGTDNFLNVYNSKGEIRAQRLLRTAGKLVRFLENEIMVVELGGTIRFYDLHNVRPLRTAFYKAPYPVKSDCVNGKFACVNSRGALNIYRHADKPPVEFGNGALCDALALSPIGPWCAVASAGSFRVIHDQTGQLIQQNNRFSSIKHLCWHPQRPLVAVADGNQVNLFLVR